MLSVINPAKNLSTANCGVLQQTACTNPVNSGTGNKYQLEVDYVGLGINQLRAERIYNSGGTTPLVVESIGFGSNWRGYYDRSIIFSGKVIVKRPDGKQYYFNLVTGAWVGDADVVGKLVELGVDAAGNPTGWTYTNESDEIETYNAFGKLISITNRAGLVQTLSYSCTTVSPTCPVATPATVAPMAGLLITVTDSAGRKINFTYDAVARVATMTDPSGGVYLYTYSGIQPTDNLTSVTYPGNKVRTYLYGEAANVSATPNAGVSYAHALTGILDENGARYASWTYDAAGRATSSEHGASGSGIDHVGLAYGAPDVNGNSTTTVTDPRGNIRSYAFGTILGVVKNTGITGQPCNGCSASFTYDANGNVASRTDFKGNTTCYAYDLTRNLETVRLEGVAPLTACPANLATYIPSTAAGSVERKITTLWHASLRLPTLITEPGRTTAYVYDPATNNLLSKTVTDTASAKSLVWTYTYTTSADLTIPNLLKTIKGPRTDVSSITGYGYYPNGDLKTVTDALGHVTTITSLDAAGRPLSITDPNGIVTVLGYTPRGWLASRKVGLLTTNYGYDGVGQIARVTLPDGSHLDYTYDAAHRLTDIANARLDHIHYTLDNMGNRTREDVYDASGKLSQTRSRVFDNLNRLAQDIRAYNATTSYTTNYSYDANGNLNKVTDARNNATAYSYDALDRIGKTTDAALGVAQYAYDAVDQLNTVTDPRSLNTRYALNTLGDQTRLTSPDTGITNRTFDSAGNIASATDARGIAVNYVYDALNRPVSITYPATAKTITYTWDAGVGCSFGVGRVCQLTESNKTTTFAYDNQGNLTQRTRVVFGATLVTRYAYDAANRLTATITPGSETLSVVRDIAGRIQNVADTNANGTTTVAANIQYDGAGQATAQSLGNGVMQASGYDLAGHPSAQTYDTPPGGADNDVPTLPEWGALLMAGLLVTIGYRRSLTSARLMQCAVLGLALLLTQGLTPSSAYADTSTYSYDPVGNVGSRTTPLGTTSYAYDALNRLVSEAGPAGTQSFTYDANGNRLSDGAGIYTYNAAGNQMLTRRGVAVTVDAAGNITSDGQRSYTYNEEGQLSQLRKANVLVASYDYDERGLRIRKVTTAAAPQGAQTVLYTYDEAGHLLEESTATGAPLRTYVWRDETPIAQIDHTPARRILYFDTDQLNTPRAARDQLGNVVWRWESDAFGSTAPNENPNGAGIVTVNLRFPGQYYDVESGLHYNGHRYYDPAVGMYTQSDPIGLNGGSFSTYTYVGGNPLSRIDPYGLWSVRVGGYVGFGGGVEVTGSGLSIQSLSFMGGVGLGGGISINPWGNKPDENASCKSNSLGVYAEAGVGAPGVDVGVGVNYGGTQTINGQGAVSWNQYGGLDPAFSGSAGSGGFPVHFGSVGVEVGVSAGVQITHNF